MEPTSSSSKMGIMCLVCQEYGDHLTSKCPHNRCKSCGIRGHVNKDCLTRDLLNISKYKYSSEPEYVIKPPLDNIQMMPMTYENELEGNFFFSYNSVIFTKCVESVGNKY